MVSLLLWIRRIRITIGRTEKGMISEDLRLERMGKATRSFLMTQGLEFYKTNMVIFNYLINTGIRLLLTLMGIFSV